MRGSVARLWWPVAEPRPLHRCCRPGDPPLPAGGGDLQPRGSQLDSDAAVVIRTADRHSCELGQHVGVRVAVLVVGAGADHRHVSSDSGQKARRVGVPTVVGHLEQIGGQQVWVAQEARLRGDLGVPGEQRRAAAGRDPQHQGVLVRVVAQGAVGRRAQHLHHRPAQREARPRSHRHDGDPAQLGDLIRLGRRARRTLRQRHGAHQEQSDRQGFQDRGKTVAVVRVGVGEDHRVQAIDAMGPQRCPRRRRIRTPVHKHGSCRAARASRSLDQHCVALPHIEGRDREDARLELGARPDSPGSEQQHADQRQARRPSAQHQRQHHERNDR